MTDHVEQERHVDDGDRGPAGQVSFRGPDTAEHRSALDAAAAAFEGYLNRSGQRGPGRDGAGEDVTLPDGAAEQDRREPVGAGSTADRLGVGELRRTMRRTLDLYLELAERFFDASTRSFESVLRQRGVSVTNEGEAPWVPLRVRARPDETASVTVWVHNTTHEVLVGATYVVSELQSNTGGRLPGNVATVEPSALAELPAGSSVSATLTVAIDADAEAGTYFGYVFIPPYPEAVVPLSVEVVAADEPSPNGDRDPSGSGT